jgi:hypothetical protein
MTVKESHQNYNRTAEAVIVLPFLNYSSPLKNMAYYFSKGYLSETLNIKVPPQSISLLIRELGSNRIPTTAYMKQISGGEKFILIDATSIISYSDNLTKVALGLSKSKQ